MNLFTKQQQIHRLREKIYGFQGGGGGEEWREGIVRELSISI